MGVCILTFMRDSREVCVEDDGVGGMYSISDWTPTLEVKWQSVSAPTWQLRC
jgi:hypothetical protein